jgi:hypothetical protein
LINDGEKGSEEKAFIESKSQISKKKSMRHHI